MMHVLLFSSRIALAGSLAVAMLLTSAQSAGRAEEVRPMDGAFLQLHDLHKIPIQEWGRELDAMRTVKMSVAVLNWTEADGRKLFSDPDPLPAMLDEAGKHGMKVVLGLRWDKEWWKQSGDAKYLAAEAGRNVALAEELQRRYADRPAFFGYYLPHELWDGPYSDAQVAALHRFLMTVGRGCHRTAPGKPVLIAPFFSRRPIPPADFERLWLRLLEDAPVDIVALQDGVGAQGIDEDFEARIVPYFAALQRACRKRNVKAWCDLESFRLTNGNPDRPAFEPAAIARVRRQMAAVQPYVVGTITFDFYHYMSPYRGEKQKALYEGYRALIEKKP